jgi:galactokinase
LFIFDQYKNYFILELPLNSSLSNYKFDPKIFKSELTITSPGRINLIGEHTDYNDGFVLPTAINKNVYFYFRKNNKTKKGTIYSKSYDTPLEFDLENIKKSDIEWENYVLGVIHEILKLTNKLEGFDCMIDSDLPIGAGISSSAALECGIAYGLNTLFELGLTKETLILLSQDAEHNFVGTKCGVMDQFAVMMSKENHVILLDCKSLKHELIPVNIGPYKIVLLNTNVSHNLSSSEYNVRRQECGKGISIIQKKYPNIKSLRDVTTAVLEECKSEMQSLIYNRCHYILQENQRVLDAVKELKTRNLKALGALMYESHHGLQHLYNVSCPELDFLVDFSKNNDQILGSRMMGGGFGGCTINIIHENAIEDYIQKASKAYFNEFKIVLTSIVVSPSKGTFAGIFEKNI